MSKSVEHELEALRQAAQRFAIEVQPGLARPEAITGGDGAIAPGLTRDELRWAELDRQLGPELAGRRVLVVGGDEYDARAFATRGASYVLVCTPADATCPPANQGSVDRSAEPAVDVRGLGWQALDFSSHGTFDVVYCDGLLHRVLEPVTLLHTLRSVTAPRGTLLIGSMILADPERSEYLRFISDRHAGDGTWRFIPGRLAFRWLLHTAGFEVVSEFGEQEGPRDRIPVGSLYLRAVVSD